MSSADFELQNSNLMAVTAVVETHSLRFNELTWMELLKRKKIEIARVMWKSDDT